MGIVVTPLLLEGGFSEQDGKIKQSDVYAVENVFGSASGRRWFARQAGGIPKKDDAHPAIPGIVARNFSVEPFTGTNSDFKVTVDYEAPPIPGEGVVERGDIVELSVDTFTEGTIFDKNGDKMVLSYVSIGSAGVSLLRQTINFEIQRPTVSVNITQTADGEGRGIIRDGLVGRINSVEWSGFPKKTWLYRGFTSTQEEQSKFKRRHIYTYNAKGWRAQGQAQVDGRVPENATLENGIAFFDVYQEFDFAARLGLSW